MKAKRLLLISILSGFIIFEILFSFLLDTANVFNQTSIAIFRYSLLILLVTQIRLYQVISSVFIGYFSSRIVVYLVNAYYYPDFDKWANNFHLYPEIIVILTSTIILATIIIKQYTSYIWKQK